MPIRALLRHVAAGVLIVASAGAVAANASARQTAVALAESAMPTWTQAAEAAPHVQSTVAQLFFADARSDQAARIRAQMERMEARARADDRLNGRVQPREGGGRGDWQQQERMRQERGNGGDHVGNWRGSRRG